MLTGLNNLYQGIISVSAMKLSEAKSIFQSLQQQARAADLHQVLDGPGELFKLKATTYVKDTNPLLEFYVASLSAPEQTQIYFVFITVPTVKPSKGLSAFHLYNNPFRLPSGESVKWNVNEGLFGVHLTIYPQKVDFMFIPDQFIHRTWRKFPLAWFCNEPLSHKRSCISDLFYNLSAMCSTTKLIQDKAHLVHSEHPLFYFPAKTQIQMWVQGLIQIEDRPRCQLSSAVLSYTFNGEKPKLTIDKATHAVIPKSLFIFTILNYTKPPAHNFLAQVQDTQQSISNFNRSLHESTSDNGGEDIDILVLYGLVILALSLMSGIASFCLYHIVKAWRSNREANANSSNE